MRAERKKKGDRTSAAISFAVHAAALGLIALWAVKSGKLDPVLKWMDLVATKKEEEKPKEEPKLPEPTQPQPQQPNQPPPPGGPARAATVSAPVPGAPPALGGTFFTAPKRPPGQGITGGGVFGGTGTNTASLAPTVSAPKSLPPATAPAPSAGFNLPPPVKSPPAPPPLAVVKPSTIAAVFEERKKAAAVTDAIGSEQIARSAGGDAGDIVSKLTAASVVDGKFVVVRGLSDRYNNTTLNGAELPSADPYRKSAQVDLFSASQIEQIVTTKTFTPDQRGDFTGAAVNIITKSFPARRFMTLSTGTSYNPQASRNDRFLTYRGGGLDWAAMDDGARQLPDAVRNTPPANVAGNSARLIREFHSSQFGPTRGTSPLNQSHAFALGDTLNFLGRPFGFMVGANYNRAFSFYENGVNARYDSRLNPRTQFRDSRSTIDTSWGAVANFAWAPLPGHELGFNFLHNQSTEDMVRQQEGFDFTTGNSPDTITHANLLQYTERQLHTFQFKGRHALPWFTGLGDARLDWLTALSNTSQAEPDLRFFNYYSADDGSGGKAYYFDNSLPAPNLPTRYFRNLDEDNVNTKLDFTLPLPEFAGREAELKTGWFQSRSERTFAERTFTYAGSAGWDAVGDPNRYLDNLAARTLSSPFGNQRYTGTSDSAALYLMLDLPVTSWLRVIGGVRQEKTDIRITNNDVPSKPLLADDTLPAAGLVFHLSSRMNLRLNYGRTLARPTFREIANYESYDPSGDEIFVGNPDLKRSLIDNFDARWEFFPRAGEILSLGVFNKQLDQPIEKYLRTLDGGKISAINREKATVSGIELEARKALDFLDPSLVFWSLGGNFSYLQSEVPLTTIELFNKRSNDPATPPTRPLYDQSPYIANFDLGYHNPRSGTSASLTMNLTGERIYIALGKGPDIYEQPPLTMDFVLTQKLRPNVKLKFTARNLTDPVFQRTYGAEATGPLYSSVRRGRIFGLSLTLDF